MTTGRRVTSEKLSELLEITACYKFLLRNDGRWKVESRHFEINGFVTIIININKSNYKLQVHTRTPVCVHVQLYNVFNKNKHYLVSSHLRLVDEIQVQVEALEIRACVRVRIWHTSSFFILERYKINKCFFQLFPKIVTTRLRYRYNKITTSVCFVHSKFYFKINIYKKY